MRFHGFLHRSFLVALILTGLFGTSNTVPASFDRSHAFVHFSAQSSETFFGRETRFFGIYKDKVSSRCARSSSAAKNGVNACHGQAAESLHASDESSTFSNTAQGKKRRSNRAPRLLPPAGASTFWDRKPQHPESQSEITKVLILAASRSHSATVIWLHGRDGDTAESWAVAAEKLRVPWCKFMFPVSRQGWLLGETERELRQASEVVLDLVSFSCACLWLL
jgi:hypothetical protein